MEYIELNNNIKLPMIGYGTLNLKGRECEELVLKALNNGYRLIDTSRMYDNEVEIGRAIKKSNIKREDIFIITKVCSLDNSYDKTLKAINSSLINLDVDYIDLALIQEPYPNSSDMFRALEEYCFMGKIRSIGVSNYDEKYFEELLDECNIIPAIDQVEAHVFFRQKDLHECLTNYKTIMQAWGPLTSGIKDLSSHITLNKLAKKYNKTEYQICLRYLIQNNIMVIPGTKKEEEMIENINIFDFNIDDEDMEILSNLDDNTSLFRWY